MVFVINFVPLRPQSSVPIFTWELDYWLDCSLPLLTLLFLYQVASISSLPLLFSIQLCESLCVFWAVENTQGTDYWLDLSLSFWFHLFFPFSLVHFQGKPFNITVIQAYAPTNNAEEAEVERFYEDLQDLLELTPPKRCPFHQRLLECKSRKPRNTWNNRQIWPWSTEWSRAKANRVLPREHAGHSKHPLPTTQEKTLHVDIIRWSTLKSDWLYSLWTKMEKLYTVSKNKIGNWLWLRSWTPYCQI